MEVTHDGSDRNGTQAASSDPVEVAHDVDGSNDRIEDEFRDLQQEEDRIITEMMADYMCNLDEESSE